MYGVVVVLSLVLLSVAVPVQAEQLACTVEVSATELQVLRQKYRTDTAGVEAFLQSKVQALVQNSLREHVAQTLEELTGQLRQAPVETRQRALNAARQELQRAP